MCIRDRSSFDILINACGDCIGAVKIIPIKEAGDA